MPFFQPNNISGLYLWFRSTSVTGVMPNSNVVSWVDDSGSGNNTNTVPFEVNFPTYQTGVINGYPSVRFATDTVLTTVTNNTSLNNAASSITLFSVFKTTNPFTEQTVFSCDNDTDRNSAFSIQINRNNGAIANPSGFSFVYGRGGTSPNNGFLAVAASSTVYGFKVLPKDTWIIRHDRFRQSDRVFAFGLNGVDIATGIATTRSSTNNIFKIGYNDTDAGDYFKGDIAEIVGYNRMLADDEVGQVNIYLKQKYSLGDINRFPIFLYANTPSSLYKNPTLYTQSAFIPNSSTTLFTSAVNPSNSSVKLYIGSSTPKNSSIKLYTGSATRFGTIQSYKDLILSEPSLINYWRLEETVGSGIAQDSKGTRDGIYSSGIGAITLGVSGIPNGGRASLFNGNTSDHISNIAISSFNVGGTAGFSLEGWIYLSGNRPGRTSQTFGFGDSNFQASYFIIGASNSLIWQLSGGGGGQVSSNSNLPTDEWIHLCGCAALSGTSYFYVNGVRQNNSFNTTSLDNLTISRPFWIGGGSNYAFDSTSPIDEVAVYNTPLTPAQVLNHYSIGIQVSGNTSVGLYIQAKDSGSKAANLFIWGSGQAARNTTLYTNSATPANSSVRLYTLSSSHISGIIPLYIDSATPKNSSVRLYLNSATPINSSFPMYTSGSTGGQQTQTTLYLNSSLPANSSVTLHVMGTTGTKNSNFTLYLNAAGTIISGLPLYTQAISHASSHMPLYIRNRPYPSSIGRTTLFTYAAGTYCVDNSGSVVQTGSPDYSNPNLPDYFGANYFGPAYFEENYWSFNSPVITQNSFPEYFSQNYFGSDYFQNNYWSPPGSIFVQTQTCFQLNAYYRGIPFYVHSIGTYASMPLVLNAPQDSPRANMPLYISAPVNTGTRDDLIPLYVGNFVSGTPGPGDLPLVKMYVRGLGQLDGASITNASMPLYIHRNLSGVYQNMPLYIMSGRVNSGVPLFTRSAFFASSGVLMYVGGVGRSGIVPLYIGGPSAGNSGVRLYVGGFPRIQKRTSLYMDGF